MTDLDSQVATLLRSITADLDSDPAALVAGGVARGRRARHRRRAGTAAAALAVVAGVALALPGGGDPGTATDLPVAGGSTPPSTPADVDPAQRQMAVRPDRMADVLASLMPGPTTAAKVWHQSDFRAGRVLLDGAQVTIIVERRPEDGPGSVKPCAEAPPMAACGKLDDGDWGWEYDSYPEPGEDAGKIYSSSATLYTADGFTVTATAYNAPGEKDVEPVMTRPVLDGEQLSSIVGSDVWLQ